jgi:DNA-binding MarR family transcriptional regulator
MKQLSRDERIRRILENMNTVKRSMFSQLHARQGGLPIPRAQMELLMAIRHMQPVSFKALAQHLYLSPGAVSQQAEILEQQGYISRQSDSADRRIQCLTATETGDALIHKALRYRRRIMEQIMQDLTDEELEVWDRIQQRLIQKCLSDTDKEK